MVKMTDNTKSNSTLIDKTINTIINAIDILNENIKSNTKIILFKKIHLYQIIWIFKKDYIVNSVKYYKS